MILPLGRPEIVFHGGVFGGDVGLELALDSVTIETFFGTLPLVSVLVLCVLAQPLYHFKRPAQMHPLSVTVLLLPVVLGVRTVFKFKAETVNGVTVIIVLVSVVLPLVRAKAVIRPVRDRMIEDIVGNGGCW